MTPEERVIVRLYPHAGSYCDGVCVVADGKSRRVDESGRANANAEHIRNAFAEAEADERERCCEIIQKECLHCLGTGHLSTVKGGGRLCEWCGCLIDAIRNPPAENEVPG